MGESGPQSRVIVSISCFRPSTLHAIMTVFFRRDIQTILLLGNNGVQMLTLLMFIPGVS